VGASLDWNHVEKTRVLFVCIGNACRSPMAEGFARTYGADVLEAESAGLAPALALASLTHQVMLEKNIDLREAYPKQLDQTAGTFDVVINMSGYEFPAGSSAQVEVWEIHDPIGESEEVFRQVRDEIEQRVQHLIDKLRSRKPVASEAVAAKLHREGTQIR